MLSVTLLLLVLMEISLSFDNAVINASVLQKMPPVWQRRFLTWGMLVAVLGMRLIFPVLIVALASGLSVISVTDMAINSPAEYGAKLAESHVSIATFGGAFLLMVFLEFMFDPSRERTIYWLKWIELKLIKIGTLKGMEIILATTILVSVSYLLPAQEQLTCLLAGLFGIGLYMLIESVMGLFDLDAGCIQKAGLMGFIYLEVLDASCSLDGVVGAFALTNNILIIMVGLGIGALAVRSLTIYLVRGGVLKEYKYLEHGAHYGIGALAFIMLTNTFYAVPELITGLIGMSFIGLSLLSSVLENRKIA